jgi:hypothetical protein
MDRWAMTDEPDQRNPWDPPADVPPPGGAAKPSGEPGAWQSDQHGYGQQVPGPAAPPPDYGQPQYGQPQPAPPYGQPPQVQQPYGQQPPYPPPQPPAYGQSPASYGYPAPTGAYGPQPYYGPSTSGKATTVLVLGILSLVLMFGCIGFILAIVALVLAPGAAREIAESGGRLTGESQLKAGKITSWITLGLTALAIVLGVVGLLVAVSNSDTSSDQPTNGVRTNATSLVHGAS